MRKLKVYFTCALSGLPPEHRAEMIALRETFKDRYEVLEFVDPKAKSNDEIYHIDIHHNVRVASFLIAMVPHRGTGLGYEMGTAIEKYGKPVVALANPGSEVSGFIKGITHPRFELFWYESEDDIQMIVDDFIHRHLSLRGRLRDFFRVLKWHLNKRPRAL